jgi:hypothetical protein
MFAASSSWGFPVYTILLGTGPSAFTGNVRYRALVRKILKEVVFETLSLSDKDEMAVNIVANVKAAGGRFVQRHKTYGYKEVPNRAAIYKTKMSFRHQLRSIAFVQHSSSGERQHQSAIAPASARDQQEPPDVPQHRAQTNTIDSTNADITGWQLKNNTCRFVDRTVLIGTGAPSSYSSQRTFVMGAGGIVRTTTPAPHNMEWLRLPFQPSFFNLHRESAMLSAASPRAGAVRPSPAPALGVDDHLLLLLLAGRRIAQQEEETIRLLQTESVLRCCRQAPAPLVLLHRSNQETCGENALALLAGGAQQEVAHIDTTGTSRGLLQMERLLLRRRQEEARLLLQQYLQSRSSASCRRRSPPTI